MITKVMLKKILAVGVMGTMSVGYVAYQSRMTDASGDGEPENSLIRNASMFSTSYVSSGSRESSYNYNTQQRNDRKSDSPSDGTSLTGRSGAYSYGRIGKAYKYD